MSTTAPGASLRRRAATLAPGLAVAALAAGASLAATLVLPAVSALLVAIVLGVLARNLLPLPAALEPGLAVAAKRVLRIGIVLLGLQLVLGDILALGPGMIAVVVAIVAVGIGATLAAGRWLGVPPAQRLLIACGFSICGAAAVAAVDGVVESEEEDVVTALALVVVFGTLMIPLVPLAAGALGLAEVDAGLWAGGSIHEVAQVVAAGSALGGAALAAAVVVKLARVLMLAPVLAIVSFRRRRELRRTDASAARPPIVPLFVVGFIALMLVRSSGLVPVEAVHAAGIVQTVLLAAAMFALGANVRISVLRRVGLRPVALGAISTLVVAGTALGGVLLAAG
ncbi:putative sulfate exporter family transporter [Agromyces sp. G08B096]|uniref:Sulfate exporter family transporter n=1 Tax=Agromyces sp. G08B096 TaxID=3156399 RepID=A0AAU7W930_9MICO